MNNQMGDLIAENLNLDLFFAMAMEKNSVRLLAHYSEKVMIHLAEKSFEPKDRIYEDDEEKLELENENGNIRIVVFYK